MLSSWKKEKNKEVRKKGTNALTGCYLVWAGYYFKETPKHFSSRRENIYIAMSKQIYVFVVESKKNSIKDMFILAAVVCQCWYYCCFCSFASSFVLLLLLLMLAPSILKLKTQQSCCFPLTLLSVNVRAPSKRQGFLSYLHRL